MFRIMHKFSLSVTNNQIQSKQPYFSVLEIHYQYIYWVKSIDYTGKQPENNDSWPKIAGQEGHTPPYQYVYMYSATHGVSQ